MLASSTDIVYEQGYMPPRPKEIDDLGVPESYWVEHIIKLIDAEANPKASVMTKTLQIPRAILTKMLTKMDNDGYIVVTGQGDNQTNDFEFSLTPLGRELLTEALRKSQYAANMPVPIEEYTAVVECQRGRSEINEEILKRAYSNLVIADDLLDKIGPALINKGAVFFYGPPGTGKTSIAEGMIKVYEDDVYIPRAIFAENEVINMYDPAIHIAADEQPQGMDKRWVLCKRPAVIVGGELMAVNLDLQRDPASGIYNAPIQLLANNGILIVDDFGRQLVTPAELLNRWIVPLSRDIDFLSLANGVKFQTPFDSKVIFSTNLNPAQLGDEAFFRRIPNKVYIGEIEAKAFDEIYNIVTRAKKVKTNKATADKLKNVLIERGSGDLRPYFPADFVSIFKAIVAYKGETSPYLKKDKEGNTIFILNEEAVDEIADIYFAQDVGGDGWETAAG